MNRDARSAAAESVRAGRDSLIALLSRRGPRPVDRTFQDSYISLTDDVVIPGSKQQQITEVATLPAADSVSADATQGGRALVDIADRSGLIRAGIPRSQCRIGARDKNDMTCVARAVNPAAEVKAEPAAADIRPPSCATARSGPGRGFPRRWTPRSWPRIRRWVGLHS